jgi:phasin family protein
MQKDFVENFEKLNKGALEAARRLGDIQLKTLERLTERQLELAADYLDGGVRQFELLGEAKDLKAVMGAQTKIASEFNGKLVEHARKTVEILNDAKTELSAIAQDSVQSAAAPAIKSAKKAA